MKRFLLPVFAVLLVLITTGYFELGRGQAQALSEPFAQQAEGETRTVQVTGQGEVQVQPDAAVISLGVQTEADSAQEALAQNNSRMETLIATLEDAGLRSADIQTRTINLGPRYKLDNDKRTLVGYTASNVVEVRVSDLDSLGTLIDEAVSDGANTVENIRFEVSAPQDWTDRARQSAFQNARHKAEQLADLANASLGPVLEVRETSGLPSPVARPFETADQAAAVPISPGSQSVSVEVQVTWALQTGNQP